MENLIFGQAVALNHYTPNIKFKRFWHYGYKNTAWLIYWTKCQSFPMQVSLDELINGIETTTSEERYAMPAWTYNESLSA